MRNKTAKLIRFCIYLLMGVQMVLGLLYLGKQLNYLQTYRESRELMDISSSLLLDEYTGILYPLLLALMRLMSRVTTIPVLVFMQILQLAAAFAASYLLAGVLMPTFGKGARSYVALFCATQPQILQMHLALLPYSLNLSAWMIMLAGILSLKRLPEETTRKERIFCGCMIGGGYAAGALLVPDAFWTGLILLMLVWISFLRRKASMAGRRILILAVVCSVLLTSLIRVVTVTPGAYGRTRDCFASAMVSRLVWPNFATNYYFWSDEIKAVMSEQEAVVLCEREDAFREDFGALVEGAYGVAHAKELYLEMAVECLGDRTKEIVTEIGYDFVDFLILPVTIIRNLRGYGTSETAWNYAQMRAAAPELTPIYVNLSAVLSAVMLAGSLVLLLLHKTNRMKESNPAESSLHAAQEMQAKRAVAGREGNLQRPVGTAGAVIWLGWSLLITVIWLTLRSNLPIDYTKALPILAIWQLISILGILTNEGRA